MKNYNNYSHTPCHHCHSYDPCGCQKPQFIGCEIGKIDLLCTTYSSANLQPTNIKSGDSGDEVIHKINDYIEKIDNRIDAIELGETLIENIGNGVPIYNGISPQMIHQIRSIKGTEGVKIEAIKEVSNGGCGQDNTYIKVSVDQVWLTNFLNQWIKSINLCPLIQGCCGTTPVEHDPVTTDITKSIDHGSHVDITSTDFLTHYTDADGHPLTTITITGTVNGYTLNGTQITSGQEITLVEIQNGTLRYTADNVDNAYVKSVTYKAKDSSGAFSNTSFIIINVAAKQFITFATPTVALIREVSNTKTSTIDFSGGTGQNIPNGYSFVSQGTVGQPGYLKITSTSQVTLNGSGSIPIQVVSIPTSTQANQTVSYTFDGSTGNINLTYNSNPTTSNITINLANRGEHTFTSQEFVNAFFDFDGDQMVEFRAMSPVTGMTLNDVPYVSGTWIPINNANQLKFKAANQNNLYQQITPWQAKDSKGNISSL